MKEFKNIKDKSADIIEYIISQSNVSEGDGLEFKVRLAVEEVVVNIVNYAYPEGDGYMEVTVSDKGDELIIELRDGGIPFNPLAKTDPDISLSADQRNIGGLGIFLAKQLMDKITYQYENQQNILTLYKKR